MSAGKFTSSRYTSNSGRVYPATVQPETLAATLGGTANTATADPVDEEVSAKMTGGKREIGVIARTVTIRWDAGAAPTGYDENTLLRIPVMQQSTWNGVAKGAAVSYLGGTGEVAGKSPEQVN